MGQFLTEGAEFYKKRASRYFKFRLRRIMKISFVILLFNLVFSSASPPTIISGPRSVVILESNAVNLTCGISSGSTPIEILWLHNEQSIPSEVSTITSTGDLIIKNVVKESAGAYRCVARNSYGAYVSETTTLTVAFMGQFLTEDAEFYKKRASKNGWIILTPPKVDAAPLTAIRWRWTFFDQEIFSNLTHYMTTRGELVILNVQLSNAGQYFVEAFHALSNQKIRSLPYEVIVDDETNTAISSNAPEIVLPPRNVTHFRISPTDVDSPLSKDIILECVVSAGNLADAQILWLHNNSVVISDGVQYVIEEYNRRLTIRNADAGKDGGVYSCQLKTGSFTATKADALVDILAAPEITTQLPKEASAELGRPVEITCVSNEPRSKIRWFFNGEECCSPGHAGAKISSNGALSIPSMTKDSVGVYQCETYNDAGSSMVSTWLRSETKGPVISVQPTNVSTVAGQSVKLPCVVQGSPPPTIRWQLNGSDVVLNGSFQMADDGSLVLPAATSTQSGWYTCVATNNVGQTESRAFVFVAGKTQIISGPEDQSVIIGSNVVFPCVVSQEAGDGSFARNWYFKSQLLTQGASRNIELRPDGSLFIRQVGPINIGAYGCTVTSASGTQKQSGNLKIVERPGMPLYVKAVLVNDTVPAKVSVSWVEGFDGNSPVIKYVIESRYLGAQGLWSNWEPVSENVGREQKSAVLESLKPSTNYEFRLTAINRFGTGMPSLPSNNVTLPQQPPAAAPQNADGSARSPSSIMFQWQPPPKDQWNGDILGYILRYRLANYPDIPWINKNITDSRARNALLEDLITWREYEIQIAAYNERGMGVFSKSRYITTLEGAPTEAPSNAIVTVINSTAAHISFSPPPQQMVPGVNLGYKIEAWKGPIGVGAPSKTVKVLPYSLSTIETVMNGLEKYVRYNVTVLCYTSPGDGPRSSPVDITTKQDVPEAVSNLRMEEVLFSSVKLVWDPPVHANGILTNYTLSYWVSNKTDTKKTAVLEPNVTTYKIDGLTASTRYSFDLFASTEVGRGPSQTANIESGVPPELPGPPTSLAVSNIQARNVTLQFTPGFDGKTTISRWIVDGLIGASTSWQPIFNITAPDARFFTVTPLRPFTTYQLRLSAENVVGRSSASDPTTAFETLQAPPEYPPHESDAQPISSTVIKVTWTPLQLQAWNGIPKGYVIVWQKSLNGSASDDDNSLVATSPFGAPQPTRIELEDPGASEYKIENLEPHSYYEIQISANNNIGLSNPSPVLYAKTYEGVPAGFPENVSAIAQSATDIRVSWQPLSQKLSNGKILGYKIAYKANDPRSPRDEIVTLTGAEQQSFQLKDLLAYTEYQISVAGFTIVGNGPFSTPPVLLRTKQDLPGPPSEVIFSSVGPTEVRVAWRPPYHPNGVLTHYSVAFWPQNASQPFSNNGHNDNNREGLTKTSLSPDLLTFMATGLNQKTFYTFAIAAETSVGWGQEALVNVYTANSNVPPPAPGRPAQSVTHAHGSRHITIVWDIVTSSTEPVRLFEVNYQRVNDDQWVSWVERVPGTQKFATIQGLQPHKAYRFRVRAINDFGDSRFSPESDWLKTLEAEPGSPPVDIRAVPFEANGIRVTWQAPPFSSWNSDFVGYRILYKPYEMNETVRFQEVPMLGAEKKEWDEKITDLPRLHHYTIQMQTFNQQGSSASSAPIFVYVGYSVPKTAVARLHAETLSSTQIRVSWENWPQQDDPVNGFKLNYLAAGRPKTEMQQDIARPEENFFILRDLAKFTNYTIEVVAFNKAGDGPNRVVSAQTLPDRPGAVGPLVFTDILLDSVNVSWSTPTEPNGIIIWYLVTYKTYKLEEEYIKQIQEKTTRNYLVVSNLEENVTTTFSVQAVTVVGNGSAVTGTVTVGPQAGSPDAPRQPSISPKESSVTLEWANAAEGRGPIIAYIIQSSLVDGEAERETIKRRPVREVLISPNVVSSLRWDTLAIVENAAPAYTVPYSQLQPGGYYRFRVAARNSYGVSYPSPPTSPPIRVPEDSNNKPFYLEWWFLVILALVSLIIIVIIVAVLYVTGKDQKYKYERRNSDQSLHLADGGIVTYELRASRRQEVGKNGNAASSTMSKQTPNHYARHQATSRPDPLKTLVFNPEEEDGPATNGDSPSASTRRKPHAVGSLGKLPNLYHSLGSGLNGVSVAKPGIKIAARSVDAVHAMEESRVTDKTDLDGTSSGDEFNDFDDEEDHNDKDVSSIVQHYETSDAIYRETWRRAKSTAHRPGSTSSQHSDNLGSVAGHPMAHHHGNVSGHTGAPPPYSRAPLPNFSSFV